LRPVGNRCSQTLFDPDIVGIQGDAGSEVTRGHHDLDTITVWIRAQRGDAGQHHESACGDPAG
jgi:hypothetical protein